MTDTVDVIFPHYRTPDLLMAALDSMTEALDTARFRVRIVDDHSGDGSVARLSDELDRRPWRRLVEVIEQPANRGFAAAVNKALQTSTAATSIIANTDVVFDEHCLEALVEFLHDHPSVGAAGATVRTQGETTPAMWRYPSPASELVGQSHSRHVAALLADRRSTPSGDSQEPEWIPYTIVAMRRQAYLDAGPLDEGFHLYFEDVDHCRRLRMAGWRVALCAEATAAHEESASTGLAAASAAGENAPDYYWSARARYFYKHHGLRGLVAANLAHAVGYGVNVVRSRVTGVPRRRHGGSWRRVWTHATPRRPSTACEAPQTIEASSSAAVVIGRNEAERIAATIASARDQVDQVVFVDSNSTDGTAEIAGRAGAHVITTPKGAKPSIAGAREVGLEEVRRILPGAAFVQFVDGDTCLEPDWVPRAIRLMKGGDDIGGVKGGLTERSRRSTLAKRLQHMEWGQLSPTGSVCLRVAALDRAGGFDPTVTVGGEDLELYARFEDAGWPIAVVEVPMGTHDIGDSGLRALTKRARRSGGANAALLAAHGNPMGRGGWRAVARPWLWAGLPLLAHAIPVAAPMRLTATLWTMGIGRTYSSARRKHGWASNDARLYAAWCFICKFAECVGQVEWALRGSDHRLIYK